MSDLEDYKKARERVNEIKSFYVHVITYVFVNILLLIINLLQGDGHWWFYWPLLGWGIGLFIHGFSVYGMDNLMGKDWEDRKVQEVMKKQRERKTQLNLEDEADEA